MTTPLNPQAIMDDLVRQDFQAFLQLAFAELNPGDVLERSPHHDVICHALMRVWRGETRRLIINVPPRSLKSFTISVAYIAWLLGQDPTLKTIGVSYSQDLASQFSRMTRRLMESPLYKSAFRQTVLDRTSEQEMTTTQGGFRLATSTGGTLTGRGGDIIIIDDPAKADDAMSATKRASLIEWYLNTLISRLDDPSEGRIILIQQRLHEEDLTGFLLEQGGWEVISLPAIATKDETWEIENGVWCRKEGELLMARRMNAAYLERMNAEMGTQSFSAQYLQEPFPAEGNMIQWDWFGRFDAPLRQTGNEQVVQSWDTAMKATDLADFSVCLTFFVINGDFYLVEVYRAKLNFPDLRAAAIAQKQKWKADTVLIEEAATGGALIDDLKRGINGSRLRAIPIKPEGDKVSRMSAQSAKIEAGHVLLPSEAPWLEDFRKEVLSFPNGRNDDQVDALSQFLKWKTRPVKRTWSREF